MSNKSLVVAGVVKQLVCICNANLLMEAVEKTISVVLCAASVPPW